MDATTWADLGIDLNLDGFDIDAEPDDLGIDPELRVSSLEAVNEWLAERDTEIQTIETATFNRLSAKEQEAWKKQGW